MSEKKKVTINRAQWLRQADSYLTNMGCYCVLGFVLRELGVQEDEMMQVALPEELSSEVLKQLRDDHPELCTRLLNEGQVHEIVSLNDSEESDAKKEKELTSILGSWGVELEFTGEGSPGGNNEP